MTNDSRTELREGDICILAPEVDHGIEVFDDSVVLNVLVRYSTFADVFYNVIRDKGQIAAFFLGNLFEKSRVRYLIYHTLGEVAERFHFSEPYCSKRILGITGMPFSELVTRIRLQNGESMLIHTQMSIADISERVGYKNPETFVRCFRRYYQMTPGQYRKERANAGPGGEGFDKAPGMSKR